MNCHQHPSVGIVATCNNCGRGLCSSCAGQYSLPVCESCARAHIGQEKADITKSFLASAVLLVFALIFTAGAPLGNKLVLGYVMAGIPWGWRVLTRITPSVFLIMPLVGWLFYFGFKLGVSVWVGIVALPYYVWSRIRRWRELREMTPA